MIGEAALRHAAEAMPRTRYLLIILATCNSVDLNLRAYLHVVTVPEHAS